MTTKVLRSIDDAQADFATVAASEVGADVAGAAAAAQAAAESTAATALGTHTGDSSDAHDASAVSFVPAGTISATDVQAALEELDTEKSGTAHTHSHASTTGQTVDDHHAQDHDHDGSPTQKLAQANTHESPDTDVSPTSLHHTLGTGATQAATGTHTHALDFGEAGDISAEAFGDTAAAGATGEIADAGHRHAMPADPVTAHAAAGDPHPGYLTPAEGDAAYDALGAATAAVSTHAGAGDPHTGYRLESADHSHATTGLQGGTVAHTALTSVGVNDHHNRDHAATHGPAAADPLKLDDLAVPDDNTDLNASATKHGLLLKLENTGTKFLRDDGTWQTPAGGSGLTHPQVLARGLGA